MTTFYFVRHGTNDWLSKGIAGRSPGVHLNEEGRRQAERVASFLEPKGIHAILSSPLERTMETAEPFARRMGKPLSSPDWLLEVNFGDWTAKSIAELDAREDWKKWNHFRSGHRAPGGESMMEVQARMVTGMESLRRGTGEAAVAFFGHGDPIRAALLYYLGMPVDMLQRLEVSPGSISVLKIGDCGAQLTGLNLLPGL